VTQNVRISSPLDSKKINLSDPQPF